MLDAIAPPRVRRGDTIAIVAPAGPVPADKLRAGLDVLAADFDLRVADDVTRADGYLAGSDERRAAELDAAIRDPDVRAIWLARGGYGIMRLLERLDPSALRADPKPIVGFSDGTAILSWAARAGVRAIHGPVLAQLGKLGDADRQWAVELLTGERGAGVFADGLAGLGAPGETLEGHLVGGNLSLIAHLAGTPWQIESDGALVILEDVGERPYAIDRYLTGWGLGGGFRGAAGALLGDFTHCHETVGAPRPDAFEVLGERLRAFRVVGRSGLPVGHGTRNRAWPYGGRARVEGDRMVLLDAAVA